MKSLKSFFILTVFFSFFLHSETILYNCKNDNNENIYKFDPEKDLIPGYCKPFQSDPYLTKEKNKRMKGYSTKSCNNSIKQGPFEISIDQSKDDKGEFKLTMTDGTEIKGKFFKNDKKENIACFYDIKRSENPNYRIHTPIYPEEGCKTNEIKYLSNADYTKNCKKDTTSPCWSKYESVLIVSGQGLIFYSFDKKETIKIRRDDLLDLQKNCEKNQATQTPTEKHTDLKSGVQQL